MPTGPKLITLKEFAERLEVSYSTVRRMVREKSVPVITPRLRPMISEGEVAKFRS